MSDRSKLIVVMMSLIVSVVAMSHRLSADPPSGPQPAQGHPLKIAFVCDASGSMAPHMDALRAELIKAIDGLRPYHLFSITFMQEKKPAYLDVTLIAATPDNKKRAEAFMNKVQATGSADSIPALDVALNQHPDLLYLLTDRTFPDSAKVLDEIHKLDPDHKVKINAIALIAAAGNDPAYADFLQKISDDSGGSFKKVDADDLDKAPQPATAPATQP